MAHILIIDDEQGIRDTIAMIFEHAEHTVTTAASGSEGLKIAGAWEVPIDCILLDIKMPGMDGLECLDELKKLRPDVPVIMISGHGTIETAVEATKKGAFDFVEKPPDRQRLLLLVRNATEKKQLVSENREMRKQLQGQYQMLGTSAPMRNIRETIETAAPTTSTVLITGENGTGKELVARAIHNQSLRKDKPFVEVNCAGIPKDLIESELFGHEKGSFTGALTQRIGSFEQADGGTLFLDEIGDMSLDAQAKVLRAIQEGELTRVGSSTGKPITVDVRIIAATNKDLRAEIDAGRFRLDLYMRLSVVPIHVAPLRERRDDIPELLHGFCKKFSLKMNRKPLNFDDAAMRLMMSLPYPGNIRELRNLAERFMIFVKGNIVHVEDVERLAVAFSLHDGVRHEAQSLNASGSFTGHSVSGDHHSAPLRTDHGGAASYQGSSEAQRTDALTGTDRFVDQPSRSLGGDRHSLVVGKEHLLDSAMSAPTWATFKEQAEKVFIEEKLREYGYNISRTAVALDIQRSHLHTKMRKYGIGKDGSSIPPNQDPGPQEGGDSGNGAAEDELDD